MNRRLRQEIDELLYLAIENAASQEQVERLNRLMDSSLDVQRYAVDYYFTAAALRKSNAVAAASLDTEYEANELYNTLEEMAREELEAPTIKIEPVSDVPERIYEKIDVVRTPRKISRFSIGAAILSIAAILAVVAFVKIVPPSESVAVLTDSIDARWENPGEGIQPGFMFCNTDRPRLLKKGVIEIEFDYGAKVTIEGPSEFVCKSDNQIFMNYGRLYARVPSQAVGFTVESENARVVDLGTEFGVIVNIDGSMELHVVKGLTKLLTGKTNDKKAVSVSAGQARTVRPGGGFVEDVILKEKAFARQINSETKLIRRAQEYVDLADIVGGGNGFGTGQRDVGIDPVTGELAGINQWEINRKAANAYHEISSNPFIDGVFVPNGQTKQVISSLGQTFSECPITSGNYYTEVCSNPAIIDRTEVILGGVNYSQVDLTSLFLHANLGITFDLEAIRSQLAGAGTKISRFRSIIGISDSAWRPCNADFWVLVDGKLRYSKQKVQQKGILDTLNLELSENDRFLTLVATDGGDLDMRPFDGGTVTSMDSDWCMFAEPVLVLE